MLTIRMIVATLVGLYTSRVVLATLGIVDYGVYGVAGSLIGIVSFLNASMAAATNRFLCVEMAKGDSVRLGKMFSSALMIHILIALFLLILGETVGLWFLNNRLNIPADRMVAANWVYQCSVLSLLVGVTQTPYTAIILTYEKMNVYAYFEILNVFLKLLIVFVLVILPGDKLIIYALLLLGVSIFIQTINRIYCIRKFPESRFKWKYEREYFKPLLKYSMTDMYGNACIVGYEQSRPILLNIYFGVIYNTAGAIAQTVQYMLTSLSTNINIAFKPQIFKLYAQSNLELMRESLVNSQKISTLLYSMVCMPMLLKTDTIIELWLGQIPPHVVIFLRIILIASFISILSGVCCTAIHATGKIKRLSYITGSLYIAIPLVVWIQFRHGTPAWSLYATYAVAIVLITLIDIMLVKHNIPKLGVGKLILSSLKVYFVIGAVALCICYLSMIAPDSFIGLIEVTMAYFVSISCVSWVVLLSSKERSMIKEFIRKIFIKHS